jgi:hypothetical protein
MWTIHALRDIARTVPVVVPELAETPPDRGGRMGT